MTDATCNCEHCSKRPVNAGDQAPEVVNLVVEIRRGERNKYEYDKHSGRLVLDRVNGTALGYPADYGYVPGTLCQDGDPLDGLLVIDESVPHGVVVPCRPVGVLYMEDEGQADEKLLLVAADDVTKSHLNEADDLGPNFKQAVEHFYAHYKDWKNDWRGSSVQLNGWGGAEAAREVIKTAMARATTPGA